MELAIDTSTRFAGVALARQGEPLVEALWRADQGHTRDLLPLLLDLLERAGASWRDLRAVIVALGPGGFTALRAGLATAKGIALSLDLPLVAVGTLEVEAYPFRGLSLPLCPVLEAGRGEVAWALYEPQGEGLRPLQGERLARREDLPGLLPRPVLVCGEGAGAVAPFLGREEGVTVVALPPPTRRPGVLARLGYARLQRGERANIATLQPLYLRRPSIHTPQERGAEGWSPSAPSSS